MMMSDFGLKTSIFAAVVFLIGLAIFLWSNTPEMFEYFNQAFCAH